MRAFRPKAGPAHLPIRQLALGERAGWVMDRGHLWGWGFLAVKVEAERVQVGMRDVDGSCSLSSFNSQKPFAF